MAGTAMAATALEDLFDVNKHGMVSKGSVVGDNGQTGYLVYAMPLVGTFDLNTDKKILQDIQDETIGEAGCEVRRGSEKTKRKVRAKAVRWAFLAYYMGP